MDKEQSDCIFCKIIAGQIPCYKVFENQSVLAFMDIGPVSYGHTLILPKMHCERLDQCPADILAQIANVVGPISAAFQDCSISILPGNNGSQAGQLVKHLHFHLIPRHKDDKVFTQWPASKYPQGKAEEILKKIRENITI